MASSKLTDLTVSAFTDRLAGKYAVPGGGGAAALTGANGIALVLMAGQFTLGKKKYAEFEDDIRRMISDGNWMAHGLLSLVDEDAAAFEPLSKAYAIPKEDPTREAVLEQATKDAIAAPSKMLSILSDAVNLTEEMAEKCSVLMISDVGCGADLLAAAMKAAAKNVFINTKSLKDRAFAEETESQVEAVLAEFVPRAEAVGQAVQERIQGRPSGDGG